MDKPHICRHFMIRPNQNSTKVLRPSVRRLVFPPAAIASKVTSILNLDLVIRMLRTCQIYLSLALQAFTKWLTRCRPIVDRSREVFSWSPSSRTKDPNGVEHPLNQRRFMERCIGKLNPKRYSLATCHHHRFCSLPPVSEYSPRGNVSEYRSIGYRNQRIRRIPSRQAQFGARFWLPWVGLGLPGKEVPVSSPCLFVSSYPNVLWAFLHKIFFHGDILSAQTLISGP